MARSHSPGATAAFFVLLLVNHQPNGGHCEVYTSIQGLLPVLYIGLLHAGSIGRSCWNVQRIWTEKEAAYRPLRTYNPAIKPTISDRDDGLEHEVVLFVESLAPWTVRAESYHAGTSRLLPACQINRQKRIYAHFILGMTNQDIARAEGAWESSPCGNRAGWVARKEFLKNLCKVYRFRPKMKWFTRGKHFGS